MCNVKESYMEMFACKAGFIVDLYHVASAAHSVLFKFLFYESLGKFRSIDVFNGHYLEKIGDATDVVFMTVRDEKTLDLLLISYQVGIIRDDIVNA